MGECVSTEERKQIVQDVMQEAKARASAQWEEREAALLAKMGLAAQEGQAHRAEREQSTASLTQTSPMQNQQPSQHFPAAFDPQQLQQEQSKGSPIPTSTMDDEAPRFANACGHKFADSKEDKNLEVAVGKIANALAGAVKTYLVAQTAGVLGMATVNTLTSALEGSVVNLGSGKKSTSQNQKKTLFESDTLFEFTLTSNLNDKSADFYFFKNKKHKVEVTVELKMVKPLNQAARDMCDEKVRQHAEQLFGWGSDDDIDEFDEAANTAGRNCIDLQLGTTKLNALARAVKALEKTAIDRAVNDLKDVNKALESRAMKKYLEVEDVNKKSYTACEVRRIPFLGQKNVLEVEDVSTTPGSGRITPGSGRTTPGSGRTTPESGRTTPESGRSPPGSDATRGDSRAHYFPRRGDQMRLSEPGSELITFSGCPATSLPNMTTPRTARFVGIPAVQHHVHHTARFVGTPVLQHHVQHHGTIRHVGSF